ncbi:MAG TPA: phosphoglucosamine mutase [candidate division Zixibacteria bacterium]|nr:phosphoglucosamine mutase [candidate division Zixibacteria bacterium]
MPTLIKSTSGIRVIVGDGLDSTIAENYARAFGTSIKKGKVVIGRDTRKSGDMLKRAVLKGLTSVGIDFIYIGIVPTPTVEIAVKQLKAAAGICITASHNPGQWNALKFFNNKGEFITPAEFDAIERIYSDKTIAVSPMRKKGKVKTQSGWVEKHVRKTLALKALDKDSIKKRKLKIIIDAINGAGSVALPLLLKKLGTKHIKMNCKSNGNFVHDPEPTPKNLVQLCENVRRHKADLGLACDPDADRLAIVDENGIPLGEELTLAIAVREVLRKKKGPVVINLSTSKVSGDEAVKAGVPLYYSKVGESNVVQMMHEKKAVIGGEGNGGVIYPAFHAGRDALVAAALVLSAFSRAKTSMSAFAETFTKYYTIKSKAELKEGFPARLNQFETDVKTFVTNPSFNNIDGLRIDFPEGWILIRKSNTEPIFRVMVETNRQDLSESLSNKVMEYFAN